MIANYQYYKDTYRGSYFKTEDDFNKAEKRVEMELKNYIDITAETYTEDEKMCCCSLSDIIGIYYETDEKTIKGINSESVSGYSVSYSSTAESYLNFRNKIKAEIELWLGNRIKKCRGVGRHVL